jgi:hypothetical protein
LGTPSGYNVTGIMATLMVFLSLLSSTFALPPQVIFDSDQYGANADSARENANLIFNSIHSSMRQWGSSIQHNGMSFFPASIPEGTLFYHGRASIEPVTSTEWLAFEVEHAEAFAGARPGRDGRDGGESPPGDEPDNDSDDPQKKPGGGGPPGPRVPGYLHVYRANRRLDRILYIDGMSAGKTGMGTLDTQDILLLENNTSGNAPMGGEWQRAQSLCELGQQWGGVDGFLRMEAGFEVIYCDFTDGLDFVQAHKRPSPTDVEGMNDDRSFEYFRAVASRYHGIGGGRVEIDYSSMVSAYFYPVNISNPEPDPRQYLPRLVSSEPDQLLRIKSDLRNVWARQDSTTIDWQGIVDMITSRYSDRLQYLASDVPNTTFISEINGLLSIYIDYDDVSVEKSIERCVNHYLLPAKLSTPEDELIHSALSHVMSEVCQTLFLARKEFLSTPETSLEKSRKQISELNQWLNWTTFKKCGPCMLSEVCYTAIWPWGTVEDHFDPKCKNASEIQQRNGDGYWGRMPGGRGPPDRGNDTHPPPEL